METDQQEKLWKDGLGEARGTDRMRQLRQVGDSST